MYYLAMVCNAITDNIHTISCNTTYSPFEENYTYKYIHTYYVYIYMLAVGTLRQLTNRQIPFHRLTQVGSCQIMADDPRGRLPSYRPSGEDSGTP
jgi:hypothetical protein